MGQLIDLAERRARKLGVALDEELENDPNDPDAEQNKLWDKLKGQAEFAWEWRSHEDLDAMVETIGALRARIVVSAADATSV